MHETSPEPLFNGKIPERTILDFPFSIFPAGIFFGELRRGRAANATKTMAQKAADRAEYPGVNKLQETIQITGSHTRQDTIAYD